MPDIERVLNAGTSPLDFTLHDAEHSFRVAEWMARIVPDDVLPKLSVYELALLLLSAYLHDIGMAPEQAGYSDTGNIWSSDLRRENSPRRRSPNSSAG